MTIDTSLVKHWLETYKRGLEEDKNNPFKQGGAMACKGLSDLVNTYEETEGFKIAKSLNKERE